MGEVNLPEGWAQTVISDIADVNPKKIEAEAEALSGFVPMPHAPTDFNGTLSFEEKPWGEIKKSYTNFQDHDVIVAKVTPCFENGKAAIVRGLPNGIGAGSSEFYVLRPAIKEVSTRFLFSIVKSHKFLQEGAANMTGAVGLRRVPRAFVETFPIALPPLAEQKVIANKLDTLLAQVETTKARLDRIPKILKTFRQSVLAAAVSGKLTEEWRGAKKVSFNPTRLKAITAISGGKTPSKSNSNYWEGGDIPWVSPKDMKTDLIASSQDKITKEAIDTGGMKLVPSNSILVVTRSGILAHSFPVARTLAPVTINQDIKALVPNLGFISPEFLFYLLKGLERRILEECPKAGTTVSSVETSLLMNLEFELPSLEEQTEIVRRVEELFAFADSIEQKTNAALERVNNLTQSILAKAFRGELTADWRAANPELISGDNSAEALLMKIKAERETLKKQPKKKTAARKKA